MSGKGDTPRPMFVSQDEFDSNWERTFGRHPKKAQLILNELTELAQEIGMYCNHCDGKGYLYWDDEQAPCPLCRRD